ncbi:JmjC domain-containing protein [Balamuthia mandrillaris]
MMRHCKPLSSAQRAKPSQHTIELQDEWFEKGNFRWAERIEYKDFDQQKHLHETVIKRGVPLILQNTTQTWDPDSSFRHTFTLEWLKDKYGDMDILGPRDNDQVTDREGWKLKDYVEYVELPAHERKERLYGKDITSPTEWIEHVENNLYPCLLWKRKEDLLGDVPCTAQAESVMIYVGYHGTQTPAHKDIMGTLGHNVMVWGEPGAMALWFMVATHDRELVKAYWEQHGSSIDDDNYFMPVEDLLKAPFLVYVIKQQEGDLVLVPPEAAHQVINQGGVSCKFAWNRLSPQTLELSLESALPTYRKKSKPEVYRVKVAAIHGLLVRSRRVDELFGNESDDGTSFVQNSRSWSGGKKSSQHDKDQQEETEEVKEEEEESIAVVVKENAETKEKETETDIQKEEAELPNQEKEISQKEANMDVEKDTEDNEVAVIVSNRVKENGEKPDDTKEQDHEKADTLTTEENESEKQDNQQVIIECRRLLMDFPPLLRVVEKMLRDEWIDIDYVNKLSAKVAREFSVAKFDDVIPFIRSCNLCRCDIGNRCFHKIPCGKPMTAAQKRQAEADYEAWESELDYCFDCVAEGRPLCKGFVKRWLTVTQYFSRGELLGIYKRGLKAYYSTLQHYHRSVEQLRQEKEKEDRETAFFLVDRYLPPSDLHEGFTKPPAGIAASVGTRAWLCMVRAVSCHSCHVRKPDTSLMRCTNEKPNGGSICGAVYCDNCLWRYWKLDCNELRQKGSWTCYLCRKNCCCATCKYKERKKAENKNKKKRPHSPRHTKTKNQKDNDNNEAAQAEEEKDNHEIERVENGQEEQNEGDDTSSNRASPRKAKKRRKGEGDDGKTASSNRRKGSTKAKQRRKTGVGQEENEEVRGDYVYYDVISKPKGRKTYNSMKAQMTLPDD